MTLRTFWSVCWRWLVLSLALVVINMVCNTLLPQPALIANMPKPVDVGRALGSLLFIDSLYALVMLFAARQATHGGWKLYLALVVFQFGCSSFMLQMETLAFHKAFPLLSVPDILLLLLNGLVVSLLFNLLVVTMTGKWKNTGTMHLPDLSAIAVSAVIYPVIYLAFGFFVAYGSEATRNFYANTSLGGSSELSSQVVLVAFQILRGALWAVCCLPIAALLSRREELIGILGLGLPVFTALHLISNNPIMPEAVRYAHGFELAISMALFGIALGFLLSQRNEPTKRETYA
jgi:hypothetical protein